MQKNPTVLSLLLSLSLVPAFAQNNDFLSYINEYKGIAVREMDRTGVPASIKLAQAILESNAGKSELARRANNHFGMKCHSDWTGKTYEQEDDDYDDFGNLKKSCFRKYKDAEDSFIAHSEFLRDPRKANRYGFLFRLAPTDYKRWAKGLYSAGYATARGYDDRLIRLIETYKLHEFDKLSGSSFAEGGSGKRRRPRQGDTIEGLDVHRVNDVRVVFAKNNQTPEAISMLSRVPLKRLERFNDQLPDAETALPTDYRVFLQPKRCRARGTSKWHYVKSNETLFDISQHYGVDLNRLRNRNRIPEGAEPQANQRIKLRGFNLPKGSQPRLTTEPKPTETMPVLGPDDDFMQDEDLNPDPGNPDTTGPPPVPDDSDPNPQLDTGATYHTVEKGDTLYNIARRYGLTVDALKQLNSLNENTIKIGQKLRVK